MFAKILLNQLTPNIKNNARQIQVWFPERNVNDRTAFSYRPNNRKKYEYCQNIWQLFVDIKMVDDNIHRKSLYNVMEDFGIPKKLVTLAKMCMEDTQYKIRVGHTISEAFEVSTGLKQGYSLSPTLFIIALEKAIREMQREITGVAIGQHRIQVLRFTDDLNILGISIESTERVAQVLE